MGTVNQWTPAPPKQAECADGYGTRTGGSVTVQGDTWSCTGCHNSATAEDPHHAAQQHAADCLSVGITSKEN
ncbi:hypothetical protein ACIQWB_37745 [Streptomyces olivaceus]|uniref:hypothetical protein n=1 Tax=Streptomyces olivaceus TaxID=47716 RepID=UPI0038238133